MATLPPAELLSEVVSHPRRDWGGFYVVCGGDWMLLAGPAKRGLDNILYVKLLRRDPGGAGISQFSGETPKNLWLAFPLKITMNSPSFGRDEGRVLWVPTEHPPVENAPGISRRCQRLCRSF